MNRLTAWILTFLLAVLFLWAYVIADACEWDAKMKRAGAKQPACFWER